jgi:hypothetical protein
MAAGDEHQPLCTLELIAEGHATRCPGEDCAFWEHGCTLARIETQLDGRPEVAALLLELRREIVAGRRVALEEARSRLSAALDADDPSLGHLGPAGGAMTPV